MYRIEIPALPVAEALNTLSEQTGASVLFPYALAKDKQANPVAGRYTLPHALEILLRGTGLSGGLSAKGVVTISAAGSDAPINGEATMISDEVRQGEQTSSEQPPSKSRGWARFRGAVGAVLSTLALSATARGQEAPRAPQLETLEEIIVTAQKRTENVRDVASSISVIGQTHLEDFHVTQLTDIAAYVPGFNVQSGGKPGQIVLGLRGTAPLNTAATVASYLDEAPLSSSTGAIRGGLYSPDLLPYDVERIEVLRGPQGTLYGANTLGGLIKYVTRSPDLEDFEVRAGADTFDVADASDRGWSGRLGVNAPLIEGKLGVRASYAQQETPGYIDSVATGVQDQNDVKQRSGRVALLWQASEATSLTLSATRQSVDSDDSALTAYDLALQPIGDDLSNNNRLAQPFETDLEHFAATLQWGLGWADFISATSYSDLSIRDVPDVTQTYAVVLPLVGLPAGALTALEFNFDMEKWTQEVRLASASGGTLEWMAGAFYTREKSTNTQLLTAQLADGTPIVTASPIVFASLPRTYEEYAAFGNVTWRFSDRFDLNLGGRWAHNDQQSRQFVDAIISADRDTRDESSESVWTYSIAPRVHLTEDSMLYARVASSYRPGGPNAVVNPATPPQFESESMLNYEVGLKSEVLDHRVSVDAAVFYMDWTDIQITVVQSGAAFTGNAGGAVSQGVELSVLFRPVAGLQFGVNAAYTDATLTKDAASLQGREDDRLPGIPEWTAGVTADYSFPLPGGWLGRIGGGWRYIDDRVSLVESNPNSVVADSYGTADLNASVSNDHWTLRLFVKNAADEHADLNNAVVINGLNQPVYVQGAQLQPRTIGLGLDVRF